ncbi:MAG: hypothetical protein KBT87_00580 [Gammaproteobacteria bacterium]|jgi:hypothetical protein|nr:hypothetical protein [Gammaproteobacteria bacterium]MBQ0773149.1 hypothetical protein [Gammaproteobacteria bacterium]|tara:strand:- start:208299 stop:208640 length:342 start_codon:yes stop_codon:yes gene_type:complete
MSEEALATLSDIATEVHARVQQHFSDINPVVSVRRNMRTSGIPADAMTIDCLRTGKRIILVLHDQMPGVVSFQFAMVEGEAGDAFERMPLAELTADLLYQWITEYFQSAAIKN